MIDGLDYEGSVRKASLENRNRQSHLYLVRKHPWLSLGISHVRLWPAKPLCECIVFAAWLMNGESALEGPYPDCHWKSMGLSLDR